jgi:hypothetical protein
MEPVKMVNTQYPDVIELRNINQWYGEGKNKSVILKDVNLYMICCICRRSLYKTEINLYQSL